MKLIKKDENWYILEHDYDSIGLDYIDLKQSCSLILKEIKERKKRQGSI